MRKVKDSDIPPEVKRIIKEAVEQAVKAERVAQRQERTAFQRTEARLYALPLLSRKVESDQDEVRRMEAGGRMPQRSKDIVRFTHGGVRVSPEEQLAAVIQDMKATIAADEHEIHNMRRALQEIENDQYYNIIPKRYFERLKDEEIAVLFPCDPSTVRRQKNRLVSQLSIHLYGAQALV